MVEGVEKRNELGTVLCGKMTHQVIPHLVWFLKNELVKRSI